MSNLIGQLVEGVDRALVLEDFSGEDLDLGVVVDACATPPFLADRRVVVLRDAGAYTAEQLAPLTAYLEDPLPTTRLVVASGGGALPAKFANAFKQAPGATVLNTAVSNREAHGWFSQRLAHAPVKLAPAAAALVEEHLGEDLERLTALLATLEAAYGHGVRVDEEHLRPYLGEPGSVPPWDLTEAIDNGETETALRVLHRLLAAGDRHPLVVLAILHRHFGNVLRLQSPAITSEAEAAQALGVPKGRSTFPARKALDAARRLGPAAPATPSRLWPTPNWPSRARSTYPLSSSWRSWSPVSAGSRGRAPPGQAHLPLLGTRDAVRWRQAGGPAPAVQPTSAAASAEAAARAA